MMDNNYDELWHRFGLATHYDTNFKIFQINWFLNRFKINFEQFANLIKGKNVLEIGTGSGAFLRNLKFAKNAYGLDVSKIGTEIAKKIYKKFDNIHILNIDLMKHKGIYDIVIADQVLHHLPNTFEALKKSVSLVKENGYIFFYVYRKKHFIKEFMDDFLRFFTTRMTLPMCLGFSKITCFTGKILTKINIRLQRIIYWNIFKCFWNDKFLYDNNLRVNLDWYYPSIANRHDLDEVLTWTRILNLKIESLDISKSGFSVRALK